MSGNGASTPGDGPNGHSDTTPSTLANQFTSVAQFAMTNWWKLLLAALIVWQFVQGAAVQKIGIPGAFEITFGADETTTTSTTIVGTTTTSVDKTDGTDDGPGSNQDTNDTTPNETTVTAIGSLAHCTDVEVTVGPVESVEGLLWVPIRVTNPPNHIGIELPVDDDVFLVDAAGVQYSLNRFAQLSNGKWPLSAAVRPGGSFEGLLIFDRSGSADSALVDVTGIRSASDPFANCPIRVVGVTLP